MKNPLEKEHEHPGSHAQSVWRGGKIVRADSSAVRSLIAALSGELCLWKVIHPSMITRWDGPIEPSMANAFPHSLRERHHSYSRLRPLIGR